MALADNILPFGEALASMPPAKTSYLAATYIAQEIANHFAYATLDGNDIAPDTNLSVPAVTALQVGLVIAYSTKGGARRSAQLMEDAFIAYLMNGPLSDMWPAAIEVTKSGPDLYDVMEEFMENFQKNARAAPLRVAQGLTEWIREGIIVEISDFPNPTKFERIV